MKTNRTARRGALPSGVEVDLVATVDKLPRAFGLDADVDRLAGLIGSGRRHPILVGPSEVGKTARVHELARRIAQGASPAGAGAIWQVSLRTLDAHAAKDESVGNCLARILREAASSTMRPIVYVRDLRMLRAFDAQHALAEALAHSDVLFLGEAWPQYAVWTAEDAELAAISHVVRVDEATPAATLDALRAHARALGARGGARVEQAALARIVADAERLLPQRRLPGKAFALFEEVAAIPRRELTASAVSDRVCDALRLPRFLVDPDTALDLERLRQELRDRVVGQDDAIDAVLERIAMFKAGLLDDRRPLGVLMLAGPAGVGKTLLARQVAERVFGGAQRLVRIACAEHGEDFKVDHLFGQRSASTTDGRRGLLTRQLAAKPFGVLLLDEVEKAHPLAQRHLLRMLDEGVFVNANDEEVSLRNMLVILTSGVGAEVYREPRLGFVRGEGSAARAESVRKRVGDVFPAELLDRIDRVCVCGPLGGDDLHALAQREIDAAVARATAHRPGLSVEIDAAVMTSIVAEGMAAHGQGSGARALRRAVERAVVAPLARHLLAPASPAEPVRLVVREHAVVPVPRPSLAPVEARRVRGEIRISSVAAPGESALAASAVATASPPIARAERGHGRRTARAARE